MKACTFFYGLVLFLWTASFQFCYSQHNLSARWEYHINGIPPGSGVFVDILQSGDGLSASGHGWHGTGNYNESSGLGHYKWSFADGRTGTTKLKYDPVFDMLSGHVLGSGIDWLFYGARTGVPTADLSGTYTSEAGGSHDKVVIRQTGSRVDAFWRLHQSNVDSYGTGFANGNFSSVDFVSTAGTSGKIYFFLSKDRQRLFLRFLTIEPNTSAGSGYFKRTSIFPALQPSGGWIGSNGHQGCLSCMSGDDFEESGLCMDSRTLVLIDFWLSVAKPFPGWEHASYDCWGRWQGRSPGGGVSRNNCHRPETDGMTRCEYLLVQLRDKYPNVPPATFGLRFNTNLLGYLVQKLE